MNIPELFFLFCARQDVRVVHFCTVITRRCNEPLEKLVDSPDKCTTPTTTCSSKRPKVVRLTLQDKFYKSKTSSRFPHFASLKHVDDFPVYQGFMMPLNHQAAIQGTVYL